VLTNHLLHPDEEQLPLNIDNGEAA
jgi:hypothetical protein